MTENEILLLSVNLKDQNECNGCVCLRTNSIMGMSAQCMFFKLPLLIEGMKRIERPGTCKEYQRQLKENRINKVAELLVNRSDQSIGFAKILSHEIGKIYLDK